MLIAALVHESATARVHSWLSTCDAYGLFVSDWSITEFSTVISVKLRTGEITLDQRAELLAAWASLRKTSLVVMPVLPAHFLTAATYAEHVALGLRAGDALHLAIAGANGHSIATLDEIQGRAAVELGVPREEI